MNKILITLGLLALANASFMRSQLGLTEDPVVLDSTQQAIAPDADLAPATTEEGVLAEASEFAEGFKGDWWGACKQCYPGCFHWMRGNGKCEAICNFPQCGWDNGDCHPTPGAKYCYYDRRFPYKSCLWSNLGNGKCNWECFRPECNYDMGDCFDFDWDPNTYDKKTHCAPGCLWRMVGNDICDWSCFTKSCYYDYKDCCKDGHCDHHFDDN